MSATRTGPDWEALEAASEAELEQLRERRQRLAPEALTQARAATQLAKVEGEIRDAEQRAERIQLARTELDRREAEEELASAQAAREAALQQARELQTERQRLAAEIDERAAAYAAALRAWDRVTSEQESALRNAGWAADVALMARPRAWMIECALARALRDAGCPHGIIELGSVVGQAQRHIRPLAEADARPVEPTDTQGA
jgi:DNA repair exonuclease SbcCD ATPase subunit